MSEEQVIYHGIDFSGGEKHRQKIWVSTWELESTAKTRNGFAHTELVKFISDAASDGSKHRFLIDAPLSLSRLQLEQQEIEPTWQATVEFLASFDSPRDWRRACRKASRKEPRRECDDRANTPLTPSNLRMFKQTWHAIVSVIKPLLDNPGCAVLPMQTLEPDALSRPVWIAEGCPSSVLRARDWPHRGYKGASDPHRMLRQELADKLQESEIKLESRSKKKAIEDIEGDALDSLLLIDAARRFSDQDHAALVAEHSDAVVDGWVFC